MTTKHKANELADALDKLDTKIMIEGLSPNDLLSAELCDRAATMLRTIPELEKKIDEMKAEANPYKAITNTKMEPTVVSYTHPVKELTDDLENTITEFWIKEIPEGTIIGNPKWWAKRISKAILKKAIGEK